MLEGVSGGQAATLEDEVKLRNMITQSGLIDKLSEKMRKEYHYIDQNTAAKYYRYPSDKNTPKADLEAIYNQRTCFCWVKHSSRGSDK